MMQEQTSQYATGAILFDAALAPHVEPTWFSTDYWRDQGALRTQAGGRGGVAIIDTPVGECVWRHYRRGGLVASLMGDRYLWTGSTRSRPFIEFRLLAEIARLDLPGPTPVAARYRRHGIVYSADLITRRISHARTLAECLASGALRAPLASRVGAVVARFHQAGIWHADLNAHNVLVTTDTVHLIDFDRGQVRQPSKGWQQANLLRLKRSLIKLGAGSDGVGAFESTVWQPLLHGYAETMKS